VFRDDLCGVESLRRRVSVAGFAAFRDDLCGVESNGAQLHTKHSFATTYVEWKDDGCWHSARQEVGFATTYVEWKVANLPPFCPRFATIWMKWKVYHAQVGEDFATTWVR
jgi:hypothetical protein